MQSQGSTSSQPSFDSQSSSDSPLFSDSEQAEDDTDVFLTDSSSSAIVGEASGAAANGGRGSESLGSKWACGNFEATEEAHRSEGGGGKAPRVGSDQAEPASRVPRSQGDLLFAQKCAELQGFVRPMLELLNGLKRGRFDRGLSSFQQSVAMDRIQRIVGVLQRPNSGEKYLNTLLQVEVMLKLWFPQIHAQAVSAAASASASPAAPLHNTSRSLPPHKHRDQSHIPVKKRRLSWTGTDSPAASPAPPPACARVGAEVKRGDCDLRDASPSPAPGADQNSAAVAGDNQLQRDAEGKGGEELGKRSKYKAGHGSQPSLTWVHVAPIPSPGKARASRDSTATPALPLRRKGSPETQDSAISSTTHHKPPQNLKKPIRCQSQTVTGQESEDAETCLRQNQAPEVPRAPFPEVCPAPL
ncbi:circadian-associated transcriptional repressor-like [Pungitius pungitius]|uniref:circadian-associated transcriptional repressor-like n=1 Tax=Pungitius pungitius TaxID=134920 RepID=UPI002E163F0F